MKARIAAILIAVAAPLHAQPRTVEAPATAQPLTVEYYYRIKWGRAGEFDRLYARNHAPLIDEMRRQGYIQRVETEIPFTHMAGGERWDLRVTITYRDSTAAIDDPGFTRAWEEAEARLYPDRATFEAEEASRFALVEEHWDVIVMPAE